MAAAAAALRGLPAALTVRAATPRSIILCNALVAVRLAVG
jgi:hypothetical protein